MGGEHAQPAAAATPLATPKNREFDLIEKLIDQWAKAHKALQKEIAGVKTEISGIREEIRSGFRLFTAALIIMQVLMVMLVGGAMWFKYDSVSGDVSGGMNTQAVTQVAPSAVPAAAPTTEPRPTP